MLEYPNVQSAERSSAFGIESITAGNVEEWCPLIVHLTVS